MAAQRTGVRPILGTSLFGTRVNPNLANVFLRTFCGAGSAKDDAGKVWLDTACSDQVEGDAESLLGNVFDSYPSMGKRMCVALKASSESGCLTAESVLEQCGRSLAKLGLESLELLLLEAPESLSEEVLGAVAQLLQEGKIKAWGVSRLPALAALELCRACSGRGLPLPCVYQAEYSLFRRGLEAHLPELKAFGLRVQAASPLAGGLRGSEGALGRATQQLRSALEGPPQDCSAPEVTEHMVDGVRVRLEVTESAEVAERPAPAAVALRWLLHHSQLQAGDGIVLTLSQANHLAEALGAWAQGPLPAELVKVCDLAWDTAQSEDA